jgi:hypothetical protein
VAYLCPAQGQNGCDLFRGVIVTWSERSGFGLRFRLMLTGAKLPSDQHDAPREEPTVPSPSCAVLWATNGVVIA